ncbi:DUF4190 domain-containing protein [Streptomyces sp. NPDC003456]|uniref:DUF4190 domain-containing protein n=1 Tax=Streptomyces sp. NPDC003456 TaxID=3364683 RepID=UPI0036971D05
MSIPAPPGDPQPRDPFAPPPADLSPALPTPPPHGPYGRPYGTPVSVNAFAVAALVLGLLCFLPVAGLVLGLVALRQIKRTGQSGRGMALTGVALSSAGAVLWAAVLSTGLASRAWEGFTDAARGNEVLALEEGDCFDAPGGLEGYTSAVDTVPCASGHDGEVFGIATLPGGAHPGDAEIGELAEERCDALQDRYAMDTWAVPADVDVYHLMPSPESRRFGDRAITCVFARIDHGPPLTGSLRCDPSTLGPDQVVFLSTANAVDAALYEEPEETPEDGLAAHRAWAAQVRDVLDEQIEALRAYTWPSGARGPVGALVADLEDARAAWDRASTAADADAYAAHHVEAYAYVDGPAAVTARKALGLAAEPPYPGPDEGGDSAAQV